MLFDLSANTSARKLMILDANYPKDVSKTVIKGNTTSATFEVRIAEDGKPAEYTYQWYVNDKVVSGATGASYTMSDLYETATYKIFCKVTNKKGTVTSRTATLKVTQYYTPTLNGSYPENASVTVHDSVTLSAVISTHGNPKDYTYQWYKNGSAISGATGSTYTYTTSGVGSATFYCKVKNTAGTVTTRTATVTANALYLFKNGDECAGVTGGWGWVTIPGYWLDTSNASKSGGALNAFTSRENQTAAYAQTNSPVDFTRFNTLTIVVSSVVHEAEIGFEDASGNEISNLGITRAGTYPFDVSAVRQRCKVYAGYANDIEDYYFGCSVTQIYLT